MSQIIIQQDKENNFSHLNSNGFVTRTTNRNLKNVSHNKEQKEFLDKISTLKKPKQLLHEWVKYLKFVKTSVFVNRKSVFEIYRTCTKSLFQYKELFAEINYLRVWLDYAKLTTRPKEVYQFLMKENLGTSHALFYVSFSNFMESENDLEHADQIYRMGIKTCCNNRQYLQNKYQTFLTRNNLKKCKPLDFNQTSSNTTENNHKKSHQSTKFVQNTCTKSLENLEELLKNKRLPLSPKSISTKQKSMQKKKSTPLKTSSKKIKKNSFLIYQQDLEEKDILTNDKFRNKKQLKNKRPQSIPICKGNTEDLGVIQSLEETDKENIAPKKYKNPLPILELFPTGSPLNTIYYDPKELEILSDCVDDDDEDEEEEEEEEGYLKTKTKTNEGINGNLFLKSSKEDHSFEIYSEN
ncbi:mitotic spindle checkpoint protein bubr1 [Anaeramoeba flamelloides]|uniref:Mitotic spindle checkpoint protein bubr1 n=1 Tax=Anaeramoeba flamelloides TaxID=1746091 RepID=A0AAV8A5U7_9EUKA|nr:mitotic spindle checkpoint protein bubr1 [Anaeramoeba flamelloides]